MSNNDPSALEAMRARLAGLDSAAAAERLSLVIESLPDGFVLYDGDDRMVICNARYREIYALSAPAMVEGARFEDILRYGLERGQYAVIKGQEEAWLARRLADHRARHSSIEQQLGDGRWIQVIEHPAPDGGRVGVRIDITARKRQDRRLADIIAGTNVGTWEWNVETGETIINERWAEIVGMTSETLGPVTQATWERLCHPADRDEAWSAMERHFGGDTGFFDCEIRMRHQAGHWVWVQSRGRVASWTAAGKPDWVSGTLQDITGRKELESKLAAERDFLDQIMATSLSAVVVIDANGEVAFANRAAERILGVEASTLKGRRLDDAAWRVTAVDGGDFPSDELPFAQVMRTRKAVFDVRHTIEWPPGRRRILSVNAAPLVETPGVPRRVVCSVTDITDQVAAETALRHKEALLRGLFELCPVGIALTDLETGAFIDVNDAVLRQLSYPRAELLQMTAFDITPEEYYPSRETNLQIMRELGEHPPYEKENIRKDGSRFPVLLRSALVTDSHGRKLVWSIVEDITERKAAEAQIIRHAHYDELTGLPNRRLFQERLEGALERARRGRHIGAVAMLDLDDFKTVNDSLGHRAGDAILAETAARIRACTRATDTVARFGGDEFLVLLDDLTAPADATRVARKMQAELARPYSVEGRLLQLGVSIGIALFPADSTDLDELIRFADTAMYRAKHQGRNVTRFHAAAEGP